MTLMEGQNGIEGYHASLSKVTTFDINKIDDASLGFHFAETPELAINAAIKAGKRNPVVAKYFLDIKNPLRITGQPNGFSAFKVLDDMMKHGQLSDDLYNTFMDRYDDIEEGGVFDIALEVNAMMRDLLGTLGNDGFEYMNTFDAGLNIQGTGTDVQAGLSWIVLSPRQIRLIG